MALVNDDTIEELLQLAKHRFNVMLIGSHGIGKSTIVKYIRAKLSIKRVKELSCATLDPWTDVVGVPLPVKKGKRMTLDFIRPEDVEDAQWIVLEELNRSHQKVQDAVLEMTQFKTINGVPLPHLEMVWANINPPGKKYHVSELDPVLITRFQARIELEACPSAEWLIKHGIARRYAKALVDWWNNDLQPDTRELVPPRDLEALGRLMTKKLNWEFALGQNLGVSLQGLINRLGAGAINKWEKTPLRRMLNAPNKYKKYAAEDPNFALHLISQAEKSTARICYDASGILLALPEEHQMKLYSNVNWLKRMHKTFKSLSGLDQMDEDNETLHNKIEDVMKGTQVA